MQISQLLWIYRPFFHNFLLGNRTFLAFTASLVLTASPAVITSMVLTTILVLTTLLAQQSFWFSQFSNIHNFSGSHSFPDCNMCRYHNIFSSSYWLCGRDGFLGSNSLSSCHSCPDPLDRPGSQSRTLPRFHSLPGSTSLHTFHSTDSLSVYLLHRLRGTVSLPQSF